MRTQTERERAFQTGSVGRAAVLVTERRVNEIRHRLLRHRGPQRGVASAWVGAGILFGDRAVPVRGIETPLSCCAESRRHDPIQGVA
jgi:hypothetical protein